MATLMAKGRRRCDKLCYGSAHDGTNCKCICGGRCHGEGQLRAVELVRTIFYPEHGNDPEWRFNQALLKQQTIGEVGVAGGSVHRLIVKEPRKGRAFIARCSCRKLMAKTKGRAPSRADYERARRAAQDNFDNHVRQVRAGKES